MVTVAFAGTAESVKENRDEQSPIQISDFLIESDFSPRTVVETAPVVEEYSIIDIDRSSALQNQFPHYDPGQLLKQPL
jgi:hypothetical protein